MNEYEIPEVIEVDEAKNAILGAKIELPSDFLNGDERTQVVDPETDIDE